MREVVRIDAARELLSEDKVPLEAIFGKITFVSGFETRKDGKGPVRQAIRLVNPDDRNDGEYIENYNRNFSFEGLKGHLVVIATPANSRVNQKTAPITGKQSPSNGKYYITLDGEYEVWDAITLQPLRADPQVTEFSFDLPEISVEAQKYATRKLDSFVGANVSQSNVSQSNVSVSSSTPRPVNVFTVPVVSDEELVQMFDEGFYKNLPLEIEHFENALSEVQVMLDSRGDYSPEVALSTTNSILDRVFKTTVSQIIQKSRRY